MNNDKRNLAAFGILLILAIVSGILNSVPAIEKADYLVRLNSVESRVLIAVVFQAIMAIIYMGIAVVTYPIVKKTGRRSAMAYLIFRVSASVFLFTGIVTLLLLLALGRIYAAGGASNVDSIELFGDLLRQGRDWLNHICVILPWSIGSLFLYRSFFKAQVVPRWMSVWGVLATLLTLAATLLYMLDLIKIVSVAYFALNTPTALLEIILAAYLIYRGISGKSQSPALVGEEI